MRNFITAMALIWLAMLVAAFVLAARAEAHHWYDGDCCSGKDCRPAKPGEVTLAPAGGGWLVRSLGAVMPFASPNLRRSRDLRFHICTPDNRTLRCLYAPPPGS